MTMPILEVLGTNVTAFTFQNVANNYLYILTVVQCNEHFRIEHSTLIKETIQYRYVADREKASDIHYSCVLQSLSSNLLT